MKKVIQTATHFGMGASLFALHEALAGGRRPSIRRQPASIRVPLLQRPSQATTIFFFVCNLQKKKTKDNVKNER